MLIDPYLPAVEAALREQSAALPAGAQLCLLIDGVFVPGLFRQLAGHTPVLLFASLPGCSEDAKDASPFVVRYDPASAALARALKRCSGWPMLSAIVTHDTADTLARRLAAWCVVEVDGQRFNFRFPDTRRLPAILATLTGAQRAEMLGHAVSWRHVGRDGSWQELPWVPAGEAPITEKAALDAIQFARLVSASEPDEMWVQLQDRGVRCTLAPSKRHALLTNALEVARRSAIDHPDLVRWCSACMRMDAADPGTLADSFARWATDNLRTHDETLSTNA